MSKNKSKKLPNVSRRNAPVMIPVGSMNYGDRGESTVGVTLIRHILLDTDGGGEATLNVAEARKLGRMLVKAADRMKRL